MVRLKKDDSLNISENEVNNIQLIQSNKFWNDTHTFEEYSKIYRFDGLAKKGADKFIKDISSNNYTTSSTEFEKLKTDNEINFNKVFTQATKTAYIGGVSMIYLAFNDNKELTEVATPMIPDFLQVIPYSKIVKDEYNKAKYDEDTETYYLTDDTGKEFQVHESRVILVCLNVEQLSEFEKAMRALDAMSSIAWANAQSFWRMAAGLTHLKIKDPRTILEKGTSSKMNEVDAVQTSGILSNMDSKTTFISDDRYDIDIKGQEGAKMNPAEHFNIAITILAISFRVPKQIFIGDNAGAISGSENNLREYVGEMRENREDYLVPIVTEFGIKTGLGQIEVELESIWELSPEEKLNALKLGGEALKNLKEGGVEVESGIKYVNETLGIELVASDEPVETTSTDQAEERPKNILDDPKLIAFEKRFVNKTGSFVNDFDFTGIKKAIRGSVLFDSKFAKDAEREGFLIIDQQVSKVDTTIKLYFAEQLPKGFDLAYISAQSLTKQTEMSDQTKAVRSFINDKSFNDVTGATDEMKKDLKRVLTDSIVNERNPAQAAKAFEAYVDDEFKNKYKNRLRLIADQETITVFNDASFNQYQDAGIKKHEWLDAGDVNVRPTHQQANGQIVKIGDKFPFVNVVKPPAGIRCRCTTIPIVY